MKYFFRDKDHCSNLENGMDFHAAGIVVDDVDPTSIAHPTLSGKDVSVLFLHPFTGEVEHCWRAFEDIEMFLCDDEGRVIDYNDMVAVFKKLDE